MDSSSCSAIFQLAGDGGFTGEKVMEISKMLSAELSATWLARWFSRYLQVVATQAEMREDIARTLDWKRWCRPVASTFMGSVSRLIIIFHFDELMKDMGAKRRPRNPIVANLLPINSKHYAFLLSTAVDPSRTPDSFDITRNTRSYLAFGSGHHAGSASI